VDESRGFGEALPAEKLFERETFGTRLSRSQGVLWLSMAGELDVFTAPVLRAALQEAPIGPDETLVLDLRGVTFLDSSGLAVILGAHENATRQGRKPLKMVIKGSDPVEALFETIGAADYLELIDDAAALDNSRAGEGVSAGSSKAD
jgi:anti-sigma B factor antagonist